jgi:hypothetical protein
VDPARVDRLPRSGHDQGCPGGGAVGLGHGHHAASGHLGVHEQVADAGGLQRVRHEGRALRERVEGTEPLDGPGQEVLAAVLHGGDRDLHPVRGRPEQTLPPGPVHPLLHRRRTRADVPQETPRGRRQHAVELLLHPQRYDVTGIACHPMSLAR